MCGITGIIEKKRGVFRNREKTLKVMTDAIRHRGPDDEAFFNSDICSLGMRRLAILDLTPGLYPFTNQDKTVQLVFNGEIYNYPELKKELKEHGYEFKTHCDGEAIVHGYDLWGTEVFSHLRGMFAIALWDEKNKKLVVSRDRLGIKPLYFINNSEYFVFASEVKSFIAAYKSNESPISLSLDKEQITHLLGFMFLPESGKTIISQVNKLEPGCFMEISENKVTTKRYWSLSDIKKAENLSYEQAVSNLDDLLTQAVSKHLLSDVPLGLMLSGGVDSGLLAAIMTKKLKVETHTYTARFDHNSNESELAKETAAYLGTVHKDFFIDVLAINNNIDSYIEIFDDLTTLDGGMITTSILAKVVQKEGIKVLLLGEGADELFGGYSWFGLSQMPFSLMPKFVRDSFYYYAISRNYSFNFFKYSNYWSQKHIVHTSTFNDISAHELHTQLPNHLLMKVDKATMSGSLEARVPYLDHELVEYVYGLPANFKLAGNFYNPKKSSEKRILRDVASKYLPQNVAFRKKKGFLLPMNDLLRANTENVKARVLAQESISKELLGKKFVSELFVESSGMLNKMQKEYFTWRLFLLESWASLYNLN